MSKHQVLAALAALFMLTATDVAIAQGDDGPPPREPATGGANEADPLELLLGESGGEVPASTSAPVEGSSQAVPEILPTIPVAVKPEEAPPAPKGPRNRVVEEIIVTAQKREENLQEVPISIQAFSGEALDARGITDTSQMGQTVPSLQFTNQAGFTLIFMRGIGTDNPIPSADRSIATYIDGIYLPASQSVVQGISNVERVEVLKGPQGTLFGRNATGGAINIVTEEPGDEFKGWFSADTTSIGGFSTKASVNVPLADWLSFNLAGSLSKVDSYYENINYEITPDTDRAARLKLAIKPADNLSVSLTAFYSDHVGVGSMIAENNNPSLLGRLLLIPRQPDDFTAESDFRLRAESNQTFYYGNVTWELPWFDVKLLGSDISYRTPFNNFDFDGSRIPLVGFDGSNVFTDQKTAELQFVSNADSWNSEKLQWTAGLYYYESDIGFDPAHIYVAGQGLDSALRLLGLQLPQGLADLIADLGLTNTPLGNGGVNLAFFGAMGTESSSAYAQATYRFTDWVDLTLGGRLQRERRYLTKSETAAVLPIVDETATVLRFPLKEAKADNFSPKAVLSFHPADDALIYLSYAVGFKSGTFNLVNIYTPPNYIEPEKVTAYELGAKSDFMDGRLRLNGALFWNDIDNYQTSFISLLSGGALRFQTAGKARTRGAEIEGTFLPFPNWNPGLALTGNAAYVDAIYTEFKDGSGFAPGTGLFRGRQDFSGNRIVYTPKFSGAIGFVQTIEGRRGTYEIALDQYYNSGYFADSANNIEEDPYSLLGGRLSYMHDPWGLRVTLFGRNLLDERYHRQRFQSDFGVLDGLAPPREYGIAINWSF